MIGEISCNSQQPPIGRLGAQELINKSEKIKVSLSEEEGKAFTNLSVIVGLAVLVEVAIR